MRARPGFRPRQAFRRLDGALTATPLQEPPPALSASCPRYHMPFARILRSSALMGGAQVATLAVAFVRTKIIAQLMGPAGVGLVGVLTAFNGNVSTLAGWGLGASGVRLIASAATEEKATKQAPCLLDCVTNFLGGCWPS